MAEQSVQVVLAGAVATVKLNRPAALNALNGDLTTSLLAALKELDHDPAVRVVVFTGEGKGFCAGGDLNYLLTLDTPTAARQFILEAGSLVYTLMNLSKPVIAMVNGVAAGAGFNLALACDLVYAADTARFAQSFVKVGLVPDCGGMYLLPRIIGMHKAKELMFTADMINAEQALAMGLVNNICPAEELSKTVYSMAERLAGLAPIPLSLMKKAINRNDNLDLADSLELEADLQTLCMQTADHKEGVAAFREKRAAVFTGK